MFTFAWVERRLGELQKGDNALGDLFLRARRTVVEQERVVNQVARVLCVSDCSEAFVGTGAV